MLSSSNDTEHRARDVMSGNTIETEDTEPSVVQTQDEDSGPQKYVEL